MTETPAPVYRRNVHCSNCGDTRGGPVGHEISECAWKQPTAVTSYGSAWTELRGYVEEAVDDGGQIDPADLLSYMDELKRAVLAPTLKWMSSLTQPTPQGPESVSAPPATHGHAGTRPSPPSDRTSPHVRTADPTSNPRNPEAT